MADGSLADAIPAALVVEEAELSDAAEPEEADEASADEEAAVAVDASLDAVAVETAERATEVTPYASIQKHDVKEY